MTDFSKGIVERFNAHKDKIKPIVNENFVTAEWENLLLFAEKGQGEKLFSSLNNIWFLLPDNKYNIIDNPPGWNEFLYIIEV